MTYGDTPVSITEFKSNKSNDSTEWTVRDMLIAVLRRIDKGELELSHAILAYGIEAVGKEPGGYYMAGSDKLNIAEMEAAKFSIMQGSN